MCVVDDTTPLSPGRITAVKILPPPFVLVEPSSNEITSSVCAQSGALMTFGTNDFRKLSAVASEQSCASLQRFGTTNDTLAFGLKSASGWTFPHWLLAETEVKLIAGTCLRAYVPATPGPSLPPL